MYLAINYTNKSIFILKNAKSLFLPLQNGFKAIIMSNVVFDNVRVIAAITFCRL